MLGKRMTGCEGTHGVFPRCNLACTPCYHAKEANRVRVDGDHTESEVDAQMALLRRLRGPGQHAQLIGGEVTLLGAEDHARALRAMIRHGRKPMSMTHGDFDYDYLVALAIDPKTGERRFDHLAFAGHFDSMMYGRRGIRRATSEAELNPYRRRFCELFERLEREHGVTHYLAHNITVTPRNVDEIPRLVRDCRQMGFRMFSFQPAAFIGNEARWKDSYRAFSTDEVWKRIEEGVGARLHYNAEQVGDVRCNRTAHGIYVGDRYETLLHEDDPRDARALADFIAAFGGMDFEDGSRRLRAARCARADGPSPRRPAQRGAVGRAPAQAPRRPCGDPPRAAAARSRTSCTRSWTPSTCARRGSSTSAARPATTRRSARRRSACTPAPTRWRTPRPARSSRRAPSTRCSTRWRTWRLAAAAAGEAARGRTRRAGLSSRRVGPEAPDVALGVARRELARAVVGVLELAHDLAPAATARACRASGSSVREVEPALAGVRAPLRVAARRARCRA